MLWFNFILGLNFIFFVFGYGNVWKQLDENEFEKKENKI